MISVNSMSATPFCITARCAKDRWDRTPCFRAPVLSRFDVRGESVTFAPHRHGVCTVLYPFHASKVFTHLAHQVCVTVDPMFGASTYSFSAIAKTCWLHAPYFPAYHPTGLLALLIRPGNSATFNPPRPLAFIDCLWRWI